jgi:hypothetical protein
MSNLPGYILVATLLSGRCVGCSFYSAVGGCEIRGVKERRCSPNYNADAQDSIYIADNDEARTVYARRRLLGADHDE